MSLRIIIYTFICITTNVPHGVLRGAWVLRWDFSSSHSRSKLVVLRHFERIILTRQQEKLCSADVMYKSNQTLITCSPLLCLHLLHSFPLTPQLSLLLLPSYRQLSYAKLMQKREIHYQLNENFRHRQTNTQIIKACMERKGKSQK